MSRNYSDVLWIKLITTATGIGIPMAISTTWRDISVYQCPSQSHHRRLRGEIDRDFPVCSLDHLHSISLLLTSLLFFVKVLKKLFSCLHSHRSTFWCVSRLIAHFIHSPLDLSLVLLYNNKIYSLPTASVWDVNKTSNLRRPGWPEIEVNSIRRVYER